MARSLYFSILLITFLFSCSSKDRIVAEKKADLYFGKGTNFLMKGEYTDALNSLIKASKYSPERSDIHNNLGMAYYFKKSKSNALKHIKHAIKLDKKNTEAKSNLASIYLEAGRLKKAKSIYHKILSDLTYKKHFQTYYNLGVISLKEKNKKEAVINFTKSTQENQFSCNALYQLGILSLKSKNYKSALEHFGKGTDGPCYNSDANHYYLGLSHEKNGNLQKALKSYQDVSNKFSQGKYSILSRRKISKLNQLQDSGLIYSKENLPSNRKL